MIRNSSTQNLNNIREEDKRARDDSKEKPWMNEGRRIIFSLFKNIKYSIPKCLSFQIVVLLTGSISCTHINFKRGMRNREEGETMEWKGNDDKYCSHYSSLKFHISRSITCNHLVLPHPMDKYNTSHSLASSRDLEPQIISLVTCRLVPIYSKTLIYFNFI